jgi:nucleotide-binding universal stress UspA family protein
MAARDPHFESSSRARAPERAAVAFERLLVPIDFSSASRAAIALAMGMAECWKSEVVLFHVAGRDANDEFLGHTGVPWGRSDIVGEAFRHLHDFAERVVPGSSQRLVIDAMHDDDPIRAVVNACARHSPSLVVLGTHARDRRRWRRSRAERIARAVACPVVLVRGEPEAPMDPDT